MIALEPEAAAISCLEKNLNDFKSEAGTSSLSCILGQPNSHYMVVDIGGKFIVSEFERFLVRDRRRRQTGMGKYFRDLLAYFYICKFLFRHASDRFNGPFCCKRQKVIFTNCK